MDRKRFSLGINVVNELTDELGKELFPGIPNDQLLTRADLERIKGWGMDHIRLITYGNLLMDEQPPHGWLEDGWTLLNNTLTMAKECGLDVILDLHKTPGYEYCSTEADSTLLNNPAQQQLFLQLWDELCRRLAGTEDYVAFELLNEIGYDGGIGWNMLARKGVEKIRSYSTERIIVVGSLRWNSPRLLDELVIFDDPNIIYNFHFYGPLVFTHQRIHYSGNNIDYTSLTGGLPLRYPGYVPGVRDGIAMGKLDEFHYHRDHPERAGMWIDRKNLRDHDMGYVYRWREKHPDLPLSCNEVGVCNYADTESRWRWQQDVLGMLFECDVRISYFLYKAPIWSIVDPYNPSCYDQKVVALLTRGRR